MSASKKLFEVNCLFLFQLLRFLSIIPHRKPWVRLAWQMANIFLINNSTPIKAKKQIRSCGKWQMAQWQMGTSKSNLYECVRTRIIALR